MRRLFTFNVVLLMLLSVSQVKAQVDLTDRFLTNAGFDQNFNYTKDAEAMNLVVQGNLAEGLQGGCQQIYGWDLETFDSWSCSTTFEYGYQGSFNQSAEGVGVIPSAGFNDSQGGCLGISVAWTNTLIYTQSMLLPAGNYTIETASYNSSPNDANNISRVGWVPSSGDPIYSSKKSFAPNVWEEDIFNLEQLSSSPGKLQIGATCNNVGSGSSGRLFFDYIKMVCNNVNKDELASLLEEGTNLLVELENLNEIATKESLQAAINTLQGKMGLEATNAELINGAIDFLEPFFTAKYAVDLLDILIEAENALLVSGGSTESRQILNALIESTYIAYDNGEIGLGDYSTLIGELRMAIDNYLASGAGMKLHYNFSDVDGDVVKDMSGSGFDGTLKNNAKVIAMGKYNVLYTADDNGYLDMGAGVGNVVATMNDYTVSVYYRVDEDASLSGAGHFLWTFSGNELNSETNGEFMSYRLNAQLYQASASGWGNDRKVICQIDGADAGEAKKGVWEHILYRQTGSVGEIWLNGVKMASLDTMYLRNEVISKPTQYNWLAKPAFSNDSYLKKTLIYDFRLYNQSLDNQKIAEFAALVSDLNNEYLQGGGGDFSALNSKIVECRTVLENAPIGDGINQYPESAKLEFEGVIEEIEAFAQAAIGSQPVIDAKLKELESALAKFQESKILKNYAAGWDGNGATGENTEPTNFGWSVSPSVTWSVANGGSGNRYMDPGNGQYTDYKLNGADYNTKRILWIRYNNDNEFTYQFSGLEPGEPYKLKLNYGWHNNGTTPVITVGVYNEADSTLIEESTFTSSATKRYLTSGEFPFMVPNDNTASSNYYISIKNSTNGDCMVIVADLVVTDNSEWNSLPEIDVAKPKYTVINGDGGVWISCNSELLSGYVKIYSVTGQIAGQAYITGQQSFVRLAPGVYIVGQQKIVVR